ncbi:uncharacterized protein LOC116343987 [Contarinia nasturtii]|uniref:uncharacterized protein LOC116343987 n=1 Tax=Contarinia nasturtii TaxID=265458 RepID=UPI0012D3C481|nr:uncharacterized protein LOC116343987 [Contarinia nasturtii]
MNFITFAFISILLCNFAIGLTIISSDAVYNNFIDSTENDKNVEKFGGNNVLETTYGKQSLGKSHRFFYTVGERVEGDKQLDHIFKQTGWKIKTDAIVNLTYPAGGKTIKDLTFVMITVYQESEDNRINVSGGGINTKEITISIHANQTHYVAYNAFFYGHE